MIRGAFVTALVVVVALIVWLPRFNFVPGTTHGTWSVADAELIREQSATPSGVVGPIAHLRAKGADGVAIFLLGGLDVPEGEVVFSVYLRAVSGGPLQLNLFADERAVLVVAPSADGWTRYQLSGYHSWGKPITVNIGGVRSFVSGMAVDVWGAQLNASSVPGTPRESASRSNFGFGLFGGLPLWIALFGTAGGWLVYEYARRGNKIAMPSKWIYVALIFWFFTFDIVAAHLVPGESPFRVPHPFYHHGISPSSRIIDRWGPLTTVIFSNDVGMKDVSIRKVDRKLDGYRILALGDSFTEGQGYRYEETFLAYSRIWREKAG